MLRQLIRSQPQWINKLLPGYIHGPVLAVNFIYSGSTSLTLTITIFGSSHHRSITTFRFTLYVGFSDFFGPELEIEIRPRVPTEIRTGIQTPTVNGDHTPTPRRKHIIRANY